MDFLNKYLGLIAIVILLAVLVVFIRYKAKNSSDEEEEEEVKSVVQKTISSVSPLDLNDEDATVAALIASIECRNETKQDVRVISVKEI